MGNYESNFDKVRKALAEAEERTLEGIGTFVVGEAVNRVPVATGNLRGSLNYMVNAKEGYVAIGTNVEYAPFVEKGTYRMTAQPYLTPAVEENKARIKRLAKDLMKL